MSCFIRLAALKKKSMRRGVWFKVLNSLERAQVNLTMRMVKRVRSTLLARVLNQIIQKLLDALSSKINEMVKSVGFRLAQRFSRTAKSWGHESAETWASDLQYARFLAIMSLNDPLSSYKP